MLFLCKKNFLDYKLWSQGNEVKKKSIKLDEMLTIPPLLNSIELLEKLLLYLEKISTDENLSSNDMQAVEEAITILENSDHSTDSRILFIIKQIVLESLI